MHWSKDEQLRRSHGLPSECFTSAFSSSLRDVTMMLVNVSRGSWLSFHRGKNKYKDLRAIVSVLDSDQQPCHKRVLPASRTPGPHVGVLCHCLRRERPVRGQGLLSAIVLLSCCPDFCYFSLRVFTPQNDNLTCPSTRVSVKTEKLSSTLFVVSQSVS